MSMYNQYFYCSKPIICLNRPSNSLTRHMKHVTSREKMFWLIDLQVPVCHWRAPLPWACGEAAQYDR